MSKRLAAVCPDFPRSVEKLIDISVEALSAISPYQIVLHPRNYKAKAFVGSIEVFESSAHIYYDRDQNLCWRRYVVAKEVSHVLIAFRGEQHLASTPDAVAQLIDKILIGLDKVNFSKDQVASTETVTMLMALEILLPNSERPSVEAKLAQGATKLDIAKYYRIPAQVLNVYLNPGYAQVVQGVSEMPGV